MAIWFANLENVTGTLIQQIYSKLVNLYKTFGLTHPNPSFVESFVFHWVFPWNKIAKKQSVELVHKIYFIWWVFLSFSILEKIENYWVVFLLIFMILLLLHSYIIPHTLLVRTYAMWFFFYLSLFAAISLYFHLFQWNFMRNMTPLFMMRKCLQRTAFCQHMVAFR